MSLTKLIYRIATDPSFAAQVRANPQASVETAGFDLSTEERGALCQTLGSEAIWRRIRNLDCRGAMPNEDDEENEIRDIWDDWCRHDALLAHTHHLETLWRDIASDSDYVTVMQQALFSNNPVERRPTSRGEPPDVCCRAAGGDSHGAGDVLTACSLLLAAINTLDDVADDDKPYAWWRSLGPGVAVHAAAGLIASTWGVLNGLRYQGVPDAVVAELINDFQHAFLQMCAGQHQDITKYEPSLEDCWRIVETKSGSLFALACRAGARLATDDPAMLAAFSTFGVQLGVLRQISNDIGGLLRARGIRSDLAAGPRWTLPTAYAMTVAPEPIQARLRQCLQMAHHDPAAQDEARALVENTGAHLYLLVEASRRQQKAVDALDAIHPSALIREELEKILTSVFPLSNGANTDESLFSQTLVEQRAVHPGAALFSPSWLGQSSTPAMAL